MINRILADDLANRVHALAIEAYAPGERDGGSKPG
jgi:stress-induced morphogen